MPSRAARPCTKPGCPCLVTGRQSRCAEHERERAQARGSAAANGYDAAWRKLRLRFLIDHPFCVRCHAEATEVDHIVAFRGNEALRLDPTNLQALCISCHSSKTVMQDGGFGRMRG